MYTANVHEAKTHLSKLLQKVAEGEEVVIAKAGMPVARLVPYSKASAPRQPGLLKGQICVAEDFDDTSQDIIDAFYGAEE